MNSPAVPKPDELILGSAWYAVTGSCRQALASSALPSHSQAQHLHGLAGWISPHSQCWCNSWEMSTAAGNCCCTRPAVGQASRAWIEARQLLPKRKCTPIQCKYAREACGTLHTSRRLGPLHHVTPQHIAHCCMGLGLSCLRCLTVQVLPQQAWPAGQPAPHPPPHVSPVLLQVDPLAMHCSGGAKNVRVNKW